MKKCQVMVDVGRRKFLTGAGIAAVGAAAAQIRPGRLAPRPPRRSSNTHPASSGTKSN